MNFSKEEIEILRNILFFNIHSHSENINKNDCNFFLVRMAKVNKINGWHRHGYQEKRTLFHAW